MTLIERARQLRAIIETAAVSLDDETALNGVELFPKWKSNVDYITRERIRYNNILYRVLQNHTSQDDWTPDVSPSLFARVLIPDQNVIPEWAQPDSTNPYMTGDKVTHNGKTWESAIDNNVWEPGVYGWNEITG